MTAPNGKTMTNVAIFASGNGSNCENIIRHFCGTADLRVALVVCNRADAFVLTRAANLGIPTAVIPKDAFNDEANLLGTMRRYDIGFIVLAGFLLMIPPFLIREYDRRIINIHPSLLPRHGGKGMYGRHVHEAVLAAGDAETGITIHYVSDVCDGGEILFQASVPVADGSTADDIAAAVGRLESKHYPAVAEQAVRGALAAGHITKNV